MMMIFLAIFFAETALESRYRTDLPWYHGNAVQPATPPSDSDFFRAGSH